LAPRAKIFRRDAGKISSLNDLQTFLRYNDYKNDPYSDGNPAKSICAREDLTSVNPNPGGCLDTKVGRCVVDVVLS
jgi:hypothetical protein